MVKILHVIHGLNLGGAENFIYNLLCAIDSARYRFDFAIQETDIKHKKFQELILARGGAIHIMPDFMHNPVGQYKVLKKILDGGYDIVHIHMNAFINPIPAILAGRYDVRVIIHSHSTKNGLGGIIGKGIHILNKSVFLKPRYIRLACSNEAGRWMFGSRDCVMVPNAIDTEKYVSNEAARITIRQQYGIADGFVIGQIGRLIPLKNQMFTLKVLASLRKKRPDLDAKLMIVGEGFMRSRLQETVSDLALDGAVIFTGAVHNVHEYYSAFDAFVMPSLFEGLGLVVIEAQAAGLKSFVSDTVTRQTNISGSVTFISLDNPDSWVDNLISSSEQYSREIIANKVRGSEFDSKVMVARMQEVYQ